MCRLDIIKIVRVVDYSATTATAIQSTTDSIINREREKIRNLGRSTRKEPSGKTEMSISDQSIRS